MPTARYGLSAGVIDGKLYVAGGAYGANTAFSVLNTLEIYNPSTNSWTTGAPMPTARVSHAVAVLDGKLYAVGGTVSYQGPALNTVEIYDPSTNTWTTGTPMPTARWHPAVGVIGGKLYVVGGCDSDLNVYNTMDIFDPVTNTWSMGAPMPTARDRAACGVIGSKLYVAGGRRGARGTAETFFSTLEIYDATTNTWATGTSLPTPRQAPVGEVLNGKFYVLGGHNNTVGSMATVSIYDPDKNTWSAGTAMPAARNGLAAGVVGADLLAVGGENYGAQKSLYILSFPVSGTINTTTWTKANSPYRITGTITVPNGNTLTIEPGVDVLFDADVQFIVQGSLHAVGTETDSIRFLKGLAANWRGIRISGGDSSTIAYARISGGNARGSDPDIRGGALYVSGTATRVGVSHSTISGNAAAGAGGGTANYNGTTLTMVDCIVSGNTALGESGGVKTWSGTLTMDNCVISHNSAPTAGGAGNTAGTITMKNCYVLENTASAGYGGGVASEGTLTMVGCMVSRNSAASDAGGIRIWSGTVLIENCEVSNNTASVAGGLGNTSGSVTMRSCALFGNTALSGYGGALANDGTLVLTNCTVAHNSATLGGGLRNGTLAAGQTTLKNAVFWGNVPAQQIHVVSGTVTATYSDIQGGYTGAGNINADPLFVNPAAGDFHLQATSPCINAGDPASPLDPDGTRADMGALPFWHVRAALPVFQTWPGTSILVPVRVSKITLFGAALAFVADSSRIMPDTTGGQAFIRSHAFQGKPSVQTDWNMVGDTVFVSLSSTEAVDLSEDVLVELAFKVKPDTPADTVALAWLPFPATNLNEMEAATIDGQITTIIYGDVSHDEAVTAQDASLILQFTVHKLAAIDEKTADVTANGFVSPTDAALVLIRVLNPSYRFPVEGGAMPKPAATLPRTLAWERDGTGWALVVSDASGILAGTLECDLPTDARVEITGGDAVDWTQDGSRLTVGFVRVSTGSATLLRLDGSDGAPVLRSAEFNEGAIPLSVPQPIRLSLAQNAPNPFNPATTIRFALPREGSIRLAVYDVNGRLVRTLVGRTFLSGHHEVVWDGCDDNGRAVASGVYVYRLTTDQGQIVRRMVLAR